MDSNTASTSATVAAARHSDTEMRTLSARPQFTYAKPWHDNYVRIVTGFKSSLTIQGYSLTHTRAVYVSAHEGVYTSTLSADTLYDIYSNTVSTTGRDFTSQFPAFSGHKLESWQWHVVNDNAMTVELSATQGLGNLDLIIDNIAGYGMLTKDLSGSTIKSVA